MKKCPYCAEEIQDEAIKCRYCFSDLTVAPAGSAGTAVASGSPDVSEPSPSVSSPDPARTVASPMTSSVSSPDAASPTIEDASTTTPVADTGPAATTQAQPATAAAASSVQYTHSGHRFVLGYGTDFFGIWDRNSPGTPSERYPRTDEGWRQAWTRFAGMEPNHAPVPQAGQPAAAPAWTAAAAPADNDALQYTHSGQRYLLGYGRTFFGIWDRTAPAAPVERFGRDDAGWQNAWQRFTSLETTYSEVGLGGAGGGPSAAGPVSG